jgi:hypothetical protein
LPTDYSRDLPPAKWDSKAKLRGSNRDLRMSVMGQKQTLDRRPLMSALPPKADIAERGRHVRFVPLRDIG